jgi:outer membrane protein OmpU
MTAGVAAADITMGGWGYVGVTDSAAGTNVNSAVRLTFTGTVETDAGVKFTAFGRLTQANNDATGTNAAGINYKRVSVAYSGLTVAVGNTHTAMNTFARGMSAWGYSDGGVWFRTMQQANSMGSLTDSSAGARVLASYKIGDITVGVGSTVDGNPTAATGGASMDIGGSYSANGISFGAAIDDESNWQLQAGYTINQIGLRAAANSADSFMVGASYAVDSALTVAVAYYDVAGVDDLGLNVTYALGGGATLSATAGQAGAGEVFGLGVQFSF